MIISQTPLRISLLGGGTDFPDFFKKNQGNVLTMAIDKYVYCIVKKRFDDDIYINYSIKEIVSNVKDIQHELVREAMKITGVKKGIEITFLSDIPSQGSGLGSSSTVTIGILNALYAYKGQTISAEKLAKLACEIELKRLRKPIGIQDQYIAAFGGLKHICFETSSKVKVNTISLPSHFESDIQNHMMVFYTGRTRKADNILSEQKENIKSKEDILIQMSQLAKNGKESIATKDFELLGKLIDESWQLKKSLASKISDSHIDKMYEDAKKAGAIGGKISGAGGGGFLTLIVHPDKKEQIRFALSEYKQMPVGLSKEGSKIIFNINN